MRSKGKYSLAALAICSMTLLFFFQNCKSRNLTGKTLSSSTSTTADSSSSLPEDSSSNSGPSPAANIPANTLGNTGGDPSCRVPLYLTLRDKNNKPVVPYASAYFVFNLYDSPAFKQLDDTLSLPFELVDMKNGVIRVYFAGDYPCADKNAPHACFATGYMSDSRYMIKDSYWSNPICPEPPLPQTLPGGGV